MLKISDFDFRQLRVFKSVVDCGGFSAAESALNMNLPAISGHMSDLEARIGMRLCERGRGGFRLTEAGRNLYASTEKLLTSVEGFRADISLIQGQISGRLAIGTVDNTVSNADARIAAALESLQRRDADFRIALEIRSANQIEESVQKGRLDVGIGPFRSTSANLICEPLYIETMLLYCGRAHPLFESAQQRIDVAAIGSLDYVARGYRREAKEIPEIENFRPAAVAFNMEAVAMLVLSGRLVGFLPDHYAAQWVERGALRALRPDVFSHRVEFSCITRRDQKHSPGLAWFLQALRQDG